MKTDVEILQREVDEQFVDQLVGAAVAARACLVWHAADAPACLFRLAKKDGDDLDTVALVPTGIEAPHALDEGTAFGCCRVEQFDFGTCVLLFGYHA